MMYKEFYMMQKEPFDSHPSPEVFYKSETHRNCWNYLMHGIKANEPILLVEGDYGAGKTLLFLKLITLLKRHKNRPAVWISTPTYNYTMMLEKIAAKLLGLSFDNDAQYDEATLQKKIFEYFETVKNKKRFVYIIIDDAQEFSYAFLNKLRLLASYNNNGEFPIRLIFFAHYTFSKLLDHKTLIALAQRIRRIYHLSGLNFEETREYIYFRLLYSGASGTPVFDDNAIRLIQQISKGSPRLINNLCDNCLIIASSDRKNLIDSGLVHKAMEKGHLMGIGNIQGLKAKSAPAGTGTVSFENKTQQIGATGSAHQSDYVRNGSLERPFPAQGMPFQQEQSPAFERPFQQKPLPEGMPALQPEFFEHTEKNFEKPEQKNKKNLRKQIHEYGRIGVIILLILVIIFLSIYIVNQNRSKNDYVSFIPQNRIVKEIPPRYYAFENMKIEKKYYVKDDLNNNVRRSIHALKNDALSFEGKISPILQEGELM